MTQRHDLLMARSYTKDGQTKQHYTKIGSAFPLDGGGFRLKFDAIPIPTIYNNQVELTVLMYPPRDEGSGQRPQSSPASQAPDFSGDDLPF